MVSHLLSNSVENIRTKSMPPMSYYKLSHDHDQEKKTEKNPTPNTVIVSNNKSLRWLCLFAINSLFDLFLFHV